MDFLWMIYWPTSDLWCLVAGQSQLESLSSKMVGLSLPYVGLDLPVILDDLMGFAVNLLNLPFLSHSGKSGDFDLTIYHRSEMNQSLMSSYTGRHWSSGETLIWCFVHWYLDMESISHSSMQSTMQGHTLSDWSHMVARCCCRLRWNCSSFSSVSYFPCLCQTTGKQPTTGSYCPQFC